MYRARRSRKVSGPHDSSPVRRCVPGLRYGAAVPSSPPSVDSIDAVVFDIGGVFTIRHHEVVGGALRDAGYDAPLGPEAYHRAHHHAVRAMSDLLDQQASVDEYEVGLWVNWERGYLRALGVEPDDLEGALRALLDRLRGLEVRDVWRQRLEENIAAFQRIAAAGIPVAIVSNNDGTAEREMAGFGICQVGPGPYTAVAAIVDSTVVGHSKPDPEIFRPALEALGTQPARTLYVGDTVHADVHGARAAGMVPVQLDPYDLHADFDHARLPGVADLEALLLG